MLLWVLCVCLCVYIFSAPFYLSDKWDYYHLVHKFVSGFKSALSIIIVAQCFSVFKRCFFFPCVFFAFNCTVSRWGLYLIISWVPSLHLWLNQFKCLSSSLKSMMFKLYLLSPDEPNSYAIPNLTAVTVILYVDLWSGKSQILCFSSPPVFVQ